MRQGRTEFPAMVLKQHEDDGSLDMIVFFEAEDMIWEQRVLPKTDAQPGHCYTFVESVESDEAVVAHTEDLFQQVNIMLDRYESLYDGLKQQVKDFKEAVKADIEYLINRLDIHRTQVFGEYEQPQKALMEYLSDFDKRLSKLERRK